MNPTPEQQDALLRFRERHGRYWKDKLLAAWEHGIDERLPDGALLRQMRNNLGPTWLRNWRIPT